MKKGRAALLVAVAASLAAASARAEFFASAYGGSSWTRDSDLHLRVAGSDLRLRDVAWQGKSFEGPLYYGIRGGWWIDPLPELGVSIDFTHAKAIADLERPVSVSGLVGRIPRPVHGVVPPSRMFERLEFSHGLNTLTLDLLLRWLPHGERDASALGRLQPYVGLGVGVAIPHVEVRYGPYDADGYQLAGPAAQGLVGLNVDVVRYVSVFAEYRLAWTDVDARVGAAGRLGTQLWTQHVSVGLTLSYPWRTAEDSP
jgi:lipid A oxidase